MEGSYGFIRLVAESYTIVYLQLVGLVTQLALFHGALRFIDYDCMTGIWKFGVDHF